MRQRKVQETRKEQEVQREGWADLSRVDFQVKASGTTSFGQSVTCVDRTGPTGVTLEEDFTNWGNRFGRNEIPHTVSTLGGARGKYWRNGAWAESLIRGKYRPVIPIWESVGWAGPGVKISTWGDYLFWNITNVSPDSAVGPYHLRVGPTPVLQFGADTARLTLGAGVLCNALQGTTALQTNGPPHANKLHAGQVMKVTITVRAKAVNASDLWFGMNGYTKDFGAGLLTRSDPTLGPVQSNSLLVSDLSSSYQTYTKTAYAVHHVNFPVIYSYYFDVFGDIANNTADTIDLSYLKIEVTPL